MYTLTFICLSHLFVHLFLLSFLHSFFSFLLYILHLSFFLFYPNFSFICFFFIYFYSSFTMADDFFFNCSLFSKIPSFIFLLHFCKHSFVFLSLFPRLIPFPFFLSQMRSLLPFPSICRILPIFCNSISSTIFNGISQQPIFFGIVLHSKHGLITAYRFQINKNIEQIVPYFHFPHNAFVYFDLSSNFCVIRHQNQTLTIRQVCIQTYQHIDFYLETYTKWFT